MNKKFIRSLAVAVSGLALVSSCSYMGMGKKDSHKCSAGKCSSKKKESSAKCSSKGKCSSKHKCSSKK